MYRLLPFGSFGILVIAQRRHQISRSKYGRARIFPISYNACGILICHRGEPPGFRDDVEWPDDRGKLASLHHRVPRWQLLQPKWLAVELCHNVFVAHDSFSLPQLHGERGPEAGLLM